MLGELKDKNFYCCGFSTDLCGHFPVCPENCRMRHRKHPTPEQFKEEYGEEYPDDGAVWYRHLYEEGFMDYWALNTFSEAKELTDEGIDQIVCACTPFGKPDKDWKPE